MRSRGRLPSKFDKIIGQDREGEMNKKIVQLRQNSEKKREEKRRGKHDEKADDEVHKTVEKKMSCQYSITLCNFYGLKRRE